MDLSLELDCVEFVVDRLNLVEIVRSEMGLLWFVVGSLDPEWMKHPVFGSIHICTVLMFNFCFLVYLV